MQPEFTFRKIKEARDAYVKRLNGIYHDNLGKDNIDEINGTAKFVGPKTYALPSSSPSSSLFLLCLSHFVLSIEVDGQKYTADHVS